MLPDDLIRAAVVFFAVIDPIGNLLVFQLLTETLSVRQRVGVAVSSNAIALGILLVFILGGTAALDYLNISFASFQIAAGILLGPAAFRLVEHGHPLGPVESSKRLSPTQLAVVPLAIPLLAGPGALATAVSFASTLGQTVTLGAVAVVLAVAAILFMLSTWIFRLLGDSVLRLLSRLVGILLMGIAVDFIVEGLVAALR